jgi:hypothetical protein
VPLPLLSIIELPFGNISECLRGALFAPASSRFAAYVNVLLSLIGNALEFLLAKNQIQIIFPYLFVTPFLTRFVGVLSVVLAAAVIYFPDSPAFCKAVGAFPVALCPAVTTYPFFVP